MKISVNKLQENEELSKDEKDLIDKAKKGSWIIVVGGILIGVGGIILTVSNS